MTYKLHKIKIWVAITVTTMDDLSLIKAGITRTKSADSQIQESQII